MKTGPVIVKKYGNRRLYDTSASRYINLDEIAGLVRKGKEVRVVDARTGEDLTRPTLTQIIVEDAKEQPTGLPLELLRQLIVATDQVGRDFVMWYLKSAFNAYDKVQSALQSGLSEVGAAALSPLERMKKLVAERPLAEGSESAELDKLRDRIAELERRSAGLKKRRTRRPSARRS